MPRLKKWKLLQSCEVFVNKWVHIDKDKVELPNGEAKFFYILRGRPVVAVLGITEDKEIVLVRQYRHTTDKFMVDLPGGGVGEGESLIKAAKREFREETGYSLFKVRKLASFYFDSGRSSKRSTIFVGLVNTKKKQLLEDSEEIEIFKKKFEEVLQDIINDKILESTVKLAVFTLYFSKYKNFYLR